MNWRITILAILTILLVSINGVTSASAQTTFLLSEEKDTYVRAIDPNLNYGDSWVIVVGGPSAGGDNTYLQFDLSSIPSSTIVNSAKLKLYQYTSYPFTASVSRVMADWNELTLTYNNRPLNSNVESTTAVPYNNDGSNSGWITFDITEMTQYWVNNPSENYGVVIQYYSGPESQYFYAYSSDYSNAVLRPELAITATTPVPVTIDIDPDTLNLMSNGEWITAYIEFPEVYDVNNIIASTIKLKTPSGDVPVDIIAPATVGDCDSDGISDLMVKFDRSEVIGQIGSTDVVDDGTGIDQQFELKVVGQLVDETQFEGTDTIRVIKKRK